MLEVDIEASVCRWAERNGWLVAKLQWIGDTGWPDRTFIKNGIVAWIEFKKPGGRVSKKQRYRIQQMRDHGANVDIFDDSLVAISWLRVLELDDD